jgi:hypothetical protein
MESRMLLLNWGTKYQRLKSISMFGINTMGKKLLYAINSSIQAGTRGDYHSLNISASKSFWKNRIQLTVGGKNLLGVTNVNAQNVSAIGHSFSGNSTQVNWGRTFFCSLAFEFSK